MDYWDMRKELVKVIPRTQVLKRVNAEAQSLVKEKGRKHNYREFDLKSGNWEKVERLLDKENIKSFVEISCRAPECPMPLNVDVWDALYCPYQCRYCFANYFRASLYTSFFDNSKHIGMRHADIDEVWRQINDYLDGKGDANLCHAFSRRIPVRLGIRFEDFLPIEQRRGLSYELLKRLGGIPYPVMINTKSDLIADPKYIDVLAHNPAGAAVHITLLTTNYDLYKILDVNAPHYTNRINAGRMLTEAGVKVVFRIEPFGIFMNDNKEDVDNLLWVTHNSGVHSFTLDTYSYSAGSSGIAKRFAEVGFDFARMFTATSESQWLGSLMLSKFQEYIRSKGNTCSTFDFGNVPTNDNNICCEVDTAFRNGSFYHGNILTAARFITSQAGAPVTWRMFWNYVFQNGGFFLGFEEKVRRYWNLDFDTPYNMSWCQGFRECGTDSDGNLIWKFEKQEDFREHLFEQLIK